LAEKPGVVSTPVSTEELSQSAFFQQTTSLFSLICVLLSISFSRAGELARGQQVPARPRLVTAACGQSSLLLLVLWGRTHNCHTANASQRSGDVHRNILRGEGESLSADTEPFLEFTFVSPV